MDDDRTFCEADADGTLTRRPPVAGLAATGAGALLGGIVASTVQDVPVGEDHALHVQAMRQVLDAGATKVFVHSGQCQEEWARVTDFYGSQVLARLRQT